MDTVQQDNEVMKNQSAMSRLTSQLRNMARSSPTSPSISSSSEDSDDLTEDDEEGAVVNSSSVIDYLLPSQKQDLACRLLLSEEDGLNRDLSNLTLVAPETQARLEALLEVAGVAADGKAFTDPEVLRRLTSSVSSALDEAAAALTRMRSQAGIAGTNHIHDQDLSLYTTGTRSLVEACIGGDIAAVRKLLDEGRSVHEPTDEGESLLSLACSAGYYELVQVLLAMNANVEDRGSKGDCTPLMEASSGGFVDIVKLLLQHGANVNAQSSSGNTALHYACCGGYEDVVLVLLEHNADIEHQNENGHTPLMEAASGGHGSVALILLEKGAGINTHSSEFKESALTLACYKGHVDMVRFLLEKGADQEHKTDEMHTALMEASMDGHVEVARLLLEHGAQVNMPADSFESPLTLAACGSHVDLAHLLIDHGANLEEVNDEGYTPLMEAAREGYLPMVALLLEHGANINAQTEETQETALTLACCGGFKEVVAFLLEGGADIELGASTPLMEAATEGHVELVRFLIEKGAKVDATTATGDTALTYAAENGHTGVAEVLLEATAELEHESEGGRTPLMKAARAGHRCTVEFLIRRGANVNKTTSNNDHNVLSLACAGGHTEVVELLLAYGGDPSYRLKDNSSMLIEASKGGHTAVCLLLMDTPLQAALMESPPHPAGFATPVGSPNGHIQPVIPVHACQHAYPREHLPLSHECNHACPHMSPIPDCFGHSCHLNSPPPPVVQPSSATTYSFSSIPSSFVAPPFPNHTGPIPPVASPSEFMVPNLPISLPSSTLPLANLTPADLQSLAQALSFSASVNSLNNLTDVAMSTSAENLGIAATVNFPVIDPNLTNLTSPELSLGAIPMPTVIPTTVVTSSARTVTSTGVQTEDAISMIHRLTNSVHQLSALQNFAASHNLELVNLGEITIPPNPFQLNVAQDDGIMVAEPARPLHDIPHTTREEPIGECSPPIDIPQIPALPPQSPVSPPLPPAVDLNQQTESNHDTALTIACAGGHDDLVQLLIAKGADIEHRDKKGCTPLILASTAGHASTCKILLDHGADIEAQSDRTKDTALSLACSSGRQEVVELLLARGSNYEHRNVSDYTPLSLAASGGYVGIIKVLLNHGAEINSRTGSKLGISPLMLAAMNGHVAAVKLLLDMGSDVNAQIETNRNTALTLACFQGRQEVVGLLLDRKANVEHRAKTGLTPLMEAASGGYVEVGRVLIDRGADVNAPPVPSSRDTALTIAADKGHCKFVELLMHKGASVDVKNKKGCSPLWLAAYGGHLDVVQHLAKEGGDLDSQDNRGLSCLMAAFRKGHVKVVKWLVKHVTQFPADPDCKRFMQTVSDKDLLKKLQECMEIIISAKERQAAEANKNASILLEELDHEKEREERRKAAAAKKRDKKRRKKKKKAEQGIEGLELDCEQQDDDMDEEEEVENVKNEMNKVKCMENGIGMNGIQIKDEKRRIIMNDEKPAKMNTENRIKATNSLSSKKEKKDKVKERIMGKHREERRVPCSDSLASLNAVVITSAISVVASIRPTDTISTTTVAEITKAVATSIISSSKSSKPHDSLSVNADVAATMATAVAQCAIISLPSSVVTGSSGTATRVQSPKKNKRPEEGWKEVTRRSKKIQIPAALISRVIGRGGCNVNTIRECTSAHIDIDTNRKKPNGDCMVTIKGSQQGTRQAYNLIDALIKDPDRDVAEILPARPKKLDTPSAVIPYSLQKPSPPNSSLIPTFKPLSGNGFVRTMSSSSIHQQPQQPVQRSLSTGTTITTTTTQHSQLPLKLVSKATSTSQNTNRLPPRMGGPSAVITTTTQSKTELAPMGWGGLINGPTNGALNKTTKVTPVQNSSPIPISSSKQRTSSSSKISVTMAKSPVARQLFPPSTCNTVAKTLPKPIGSNRPTRAPVVSTKAVTQTTQSTRTTPSISANHNVTESNSTLNSFFSQMVTQVRSPMIWNDPNGRLSRTNGGDTIVTTVASMITKSPLTVNANTDVLTVSQVTVVSQSSNPTSPSFNHGPSPTPSLSPTSTTSDSPSPANVSEERPHLNPIGCERAHKRTSSASLPPVPGLAGFLPDPSTQSVWGFGYSTSNTSSSAWPVTSQQQNPDWTTSTNHVSEMIIGVSQSQSKVNHDENELVEISPNDNLQSLLERLSLSNYLASFQKNEIDLEALMLMSEQDYADIGVPKVPRVKLLKTTLRTNSSKVSRVQPLVNHIGMVNSNPQTIWNPPPVIAAGVLPVANSTIRPTPLLNDALRFPSHQIIQPAWRPWSRTDQ